MTGVLTITLNPTLDISCQTRHISATHKTRTTNQRLDPGGGGINVAKVIKLLGGHPQTLYLSGGATGVVLDRLLQGSGIACHRIAMEGDVRVAMAVHEAVTNAEYRFVPEGPVVSPEELGRATAFVADCDADYVVASGSLPRGVAHEAYGDLADMVMAKGKRFILDTSGPALQHCFRNARVFLAKPSLGELEGYVGEPLDEAEAERVARDLISSGAAEYIAVSMGAQGAFLAGADGVMRLPARHVVIRSAVGAGDSFVGGLTHGLMQGMSMRQAFCQGVAAGTAAVMTPGTELCRPEDVRKLVLEMSAAD